MELKTQPRPGVTQKKKQEDSKQEEKADTKVEDKTDKPLSKPSMTGFALDDDDEVDKID